MSLSATKPETISARPVAHPSGAPLILPVELGLVPALGFTLAAAPIGAAALESEVAEATTEGEVEVFPPDPCAKAADTHAVGITAATTSTRSKRLEASFPFTFSGAQPAPRGEVSLQQRRWILDESPGEFPPTGAYSSNRVDGKFW
jgi:hypothetical protein